MQKVQLSEYSGTTMNSPGPQEEITLYSKIEEVKHKGEELPNETYLTEQELNVLSNHKKISAEHCEN